MRNNEYSSVDDLMKRISAIKSEFSNENDYRINLALMRELANVTAKIADISPEPLASLYRKVAESTKINADKIDALGEKEQNEKEKDS